MEQFPPIPPSVNSLYKISARNRKKRNSIGDVGHRNPSKCGFNYHSAVKIIQTNMYEPVSDGCVTIINPKYGTNRKKSYDRNAEDECTRVVFPDNKINEQPPEKPPRRIKLQRPLKKNSSPDQNAPPKNCDTMRTDNGDNCIDVDHIALESERNYKNKFNSVGVQTSPLVPYRLRFWPKRTIKCDPESSSVNDKFKCCFRILSQWFLSQIGLTIILVGWALLGAAAFHKTEGPRELEQTEELARLQNDLAVDLATDLRQVIDHQVTWSETITKYVSRHETLLLQAVSAGYGEGGDGGRIWTYPGCTLFAVALLTTLGFGAPVPRTALGRGTAVLFSAIGIPLHFLLILNVGNLAAGKLQLLAKTHTKSPENSTSTYKTWLKWFPLFAIIFYYLLGLVFFGIMRERSAIDSLMFPLDFTAAGGVGKTSGHVRILYALYLECAVTLAAIIVSLVQASASRGIVDVGLKLGLVTNT